MSRVREALVPERLGAGFRWLVASAWLGNLGDGFALAAGPLLIASQTRSPTLVALATLLQRLPWLTFGVLAGVLADRFDRVRVVTAFDLARAATLGLLVFIIAVGQVDIAVVLVTMFVLGATDAFSNTAYAAVVPTIVEKEHLTRANVRLQGGMLLLYQMAGPPIGAALFAPSMSLPFAAEALLVVTSVMLVSRVKLPPVVRQRSSVLGSEIRDGFRWVRSNPPVRTLILAIFTFNVTFGAAWAVLVLYAKERLGMGAVGFGLLTTASALGGMIGVASYSRITRYVSLGNIMRIGLILETFTYLAFALDRNQAVALGIMFVFGAHAFIWSTTSMTVRQRAVPNPLLGRVSSINAIGTFGGMVIGAAIAGPIASQWGITGPFWFAFIGSSTFVLAIWGQLSHIAHQDVTALES